MFVAAVAEGEEARAGAAEIDHDEEEGRQRVDAEMGADPRQAERQDDRVGGGDVTSRHSAPTSSTGETAQRDAVDRGAGRRPPRQADGEDAVREQDRDTDERKGGGHGRATRRSLGRRPGGLRRLLEAHAAAAVGAGSAFADQRQAGGFKRGDQLGQRIDGAADDAVAGLHALDGRHRQAGQFRQPPLVDAKQRAGRAKLSG